jgi:lysozyme
MTRTHRTHRQTSNHKPLLALVFAVIIAGSAIAILLLTYPRYRLPPPLYPNFGIHIPRNYSIFGIDVSRYQEDIAWDRVARMHDVDLRIGFAFIKATEGTSLTDPRFHRNWRQATANGIPKGAYHYFIPDRDAAAQARHFIATVKLRKGDLPPVLDVEETGNIPRITLRNRVRQWLDIVERHYRVKPILYTGVDFYHKTLGDTFDEYPLWAAHYLRQESPRIRRAWTFWQFSDKASVSGIRHRVDFNAFHGDSADFQRIRLH